MMSSKVWKMLGCSVSFVSIEMLDSNKNGV